MKIELVNASQVALRDKAPGQSFSVEAFDASTPVDSYWRKRLAEAAVRIVAPSAPAAKSVAPAAKKG